MQYSVYFSKNDSSHIFILIIVNSNSKLDWKIVNLLWFGNYQFWLKRFSKKDLNDRTTFFYFSVILRNLEFRKILQKYHDKLPILIVNLIGCLSKICCSHTYFLKNVKPVRLSKNFFNLYAYFFGKVCHPVCGYWRLYGSAILTFLKQNRCQTRTFSCLSCSVRLE